MITDSNSTIVNQEEDDCKMVICFATCFCVAQMIHVIHQLIYYYPKDNFIVTLESGNTISGRPGSLFPSINAGLFILTDSKGTVQEAVSVCKIVSIAITSAAYNENITFISAPTEPPMGCDANCEAAVQQYLSIGATVQLKAGGQTVANGIVHRDKYGMVVIVDKNNNNPVFVSTCKVESIK